MAFITHYFKRPALDALAGLLALLLCGPVASVWAAPDDAPASTWPLLRVERADNALWLSAQFDFVLPPVVEDALQKGIPIYFVAQADLVRQRWYWINRTVASVQRRARLAYHPLTRRWRLSTGTQSAADVTPGLTLSQNFDTLPEAMAAVRRIVHWKLADAASLEPGAQYRVQFSFELDTNELPRPLQIGTLGQSDWVVNVSAALALADELTR
ncbi:MAG: hypothetical protein AUJ20_10495 [Comamonadaceae bacterium CG1_02_60_18]|nr:MAG: hypothetical protein AUJ20_10495 [Comamonadaceae bacterium CG1_02_60_18]